ncbi:hypothetical protein [Litchfieldella xinjiangensis]|uniref:hypothetical protein n=1 Tax=Litchfieldella xinjiangensis TaxID=1166948 RepID=UPI000A5AF5E7|nr:hypothetical protein [Halomonas xinjiangensis]
MNVRIFAMILELLGVALIVLGWLNTPPAAFVGVVLIILGLVLQWTRRQRPRD